MNSMALSMNSFSSSSVALRSVRETSSLNFSYGPENSVISYKVLKC